ncbi:MAG TPA: M48 family metalloprotease [Sphingomicrobium sp.]|jgi:predicted Zn-dependent protease
MNSPQLRVSRLARLLMLALVLTFAAARPAAAQTVLRDSETELLFRDISSPLIAAAKLDKRTDVVLLNDPEINAFVAGGQTVYVQSGLLLASDDVTQLQGVIAHELGHVAGGHAIRMQSGVKEAQGISIATMVLGALAMAAGAGDAAMGIMMAGERAAMGRFMAFTRTQESSADSAGAKYLAAAGVTGKGSIAFFKKLQNQEYRLTAQLPGDSYDRTHPLSSERITALLNVYEKDPAWNRPPDPALEARFQRVKAKLLGFINPKLATTRYPESDLSVPGHYARAYAYHVGAYPEKALSEAQALLKTNPDDPFFLELKGQILLESGKPAEAIAPLRQATARADDQPLIAAMLGHALIATEKRENFIEAKQVLKAAINRDNQNPFAWYQLGIIYDREGDQPRAALATAERNNLEGNPKLALASAEMALKGIPQGSPDYLRAQDIAMVSRTELKKKKRDR